jgi:hypothetical protein
MTMMIVLKNYVFTRMEVWTSTRQKDFYRFLQKKVQETVEVLLAGRHAGDEFYTLRIDYEGISGLFHSLF